MRGLVCWLAATFIFTIQAMAQDLPDVRGKELMVAIRQLEAAGFEVVHDGGPGYRGHTRMPYPNDDGTTDKNWIIELWRVVLDMELVSGADPSAPAVVSLVTEMKQREYLIPRRPGASDRPGVVDEM